MVKGIYFHDFERAKERDKYYPDGDGSNCNEDDGIVPVENSTMLMMLTKMMR